MTSNGVFLVSLDFELLWGVHDHETEGTFCRQIAEARRAIPELLRLFEKYHIHATWATVGMLFADDHEDMKRYCPEVKPTYPRDELSAYHYLGQVGRDETEDMFHFAPSLIRKIQEHPGQEIGSHTFSHYYCDECGDPESFREDLKSSRRIAMEKYGIELTSLVFPRNQFSEECAIIAAEEGFTAIRGHVNSVYEEKSLFSKLLRLVDTYVNVCGKKCYTAGDCIQNGYVNLKASRFLRKPSKKLFFLEPLKMSCIKRQMKHAARKGKIFHIWWHPHNLGDNAEAFLSQLEELLVYYTELNAKFGFVSKNMSEAQKDVSNENRHIVQQ